MKRFKLLALVLVVTLLIASMLSGCGGNSSTAPQDPEKKPVAKARTLKLGHKSSDTHSWQYGSEFFAKLVEERTNGEIIIEIYPNSQLGDQKEMTEAAQLGVIDIVLNAPATLSSFIPEIGALDLPFLFRDYDHAFASLDTVGMEYYSPLCEKADMNLLGHRF